MKKKRRFAKSRIVVVAVLCLIFGYVAFSQIGNTQRYPQIEYTYYQGGEKPAAYPDAEFAVISDIHFYDKSLGTAGPAFERVLKADRKLLVDSEALLDYAVNELLNSRVAFVLVSGDLTKDGERISHEKMAEYLQKLVESGIKVLVTPGNHDINNADAAAFSGEVTTPVESVSAAEFAQIYGRMGYDDAVSRDGDSLSYVAEPVEGLWVAAIDGCRYSENVPGQESIVSGKISQATEQWLSDMLQKAIDQNKAVIAVTHHGVIEHWRGQSKLHPDYLMQDYAYIGKLLASYHVRLAFTGHYHANDITRADFGDGYLYDVETGALVTYPCPLRYCAIRQNEIHIRTNTVADKLRPGTDFEANALIFVKKTVAIEAYNTLRKYMASESGANAIAGAVSEAFAAHYSGDEDPGKRQDLDYGRLSLWDRAVYSTQAYALDGLWADLPPADNNVTLALE